VKKSTAALARCIRVPRNISFCCLNARAEQILGDIAGTTLQESRMHVALSHVSAGCPAARTISEPRPTTPAAFAAWLIASLKEAIRH
jgi:hypothetical protein